MNRIITFAAAAAIAAAGLASFALSTASASSSSQPRECKTQYESAVTNGQWSLDKFAYEQGDTISDIIGLTAKCGPGGGWSYGFSAYLDRGNMHKPMHKGMRLYFLPPGGGPVAP